MAEHQDIENAKYGYTTAIILLFLLWGVRFLPFLFPGARIWGFNHLLFLPAHFTVIYTAAIILILLPLLPPFRRIFESSYSGTAERLLGSPYYFRWLIIAVLSMPLLWFFRMPITLLGDGYAVINNIANDLPVQFKWSEGGAIKIVHVISQLLPYNGLQSGKYAYAIVSVISGGVTLYFFLTLAYELALKATVRLFLLGIFVFSGWSLLFFGYAESYPILWPFLIGYIYFSVRYLKGKTNLLIPTIFLAVSLALHLQTLFFLISYPLLIFSRGVGNRIYKRYPRLIWSVVIIIAVAGILAFINRYRESIDFQVHFLPLFAGRPASPETAVLSITHLLDILNELSLLIPVWPVLLWLSRRRLGDILRDTIDRFLLVFAAGGFVFLFILDPTLGMGRDWDLLAVSCFCPLLLLARRLSASDLRFNRLMPATILASAILAAPFLVTNLNYRPHLEYVKWLMRLDESRSKTGHVILRGYYNDIGDSIRADSMDLALIDKFPHVLAFEQAKQLIRNQKYEEASILAREIYEADPYSYEAYNIHGVINLHTGNLSEAIEDLELSTKLAEWNSYTFTYLAHAYQEAGRYEKMIKTLRRVQELNPDFDLMLEGFATAFSATSQYDSALAYSQKLMRLVPANKSAYLVAGVSSFRLGDKIRAKIYLTRYLDLDPRGPDRLTAIEFLKQLQ